MCGLQLPACVHVFACARVRVRTFTRGGCVRVRAACHVFMYTCTCGRRAVHVTLLPMLTSRCTRPRSWPPMMENESRPVRCWFAKDKKAWCIARMSASGSSSILLNPKHSPAASREHVGAVFEQI